MIDVMDPFARKLVGQYLDNRQEDVGKLTEALETADFDTIRITGHNLFGSGAAYGLDGISVLGRELEAAASAEDGAKIKRHIKELVSFLENLQI